MTSNTTPTEYHSHYCRVSSRPIVGCAGRCHSIESTALRFPSSSVVTCFQTACNDQSPIPPSLPPTSIPIEALIESLDVDAGGAFAKSLGSARSARPAREEVSTLTAKPGFVPAQGASGREAAVARDSAAETTLPDSCGVVH